jgi:hypothetical protein
MRRRYRYDADLDCLVEIGGNYFEEKPRGPGLISDDLGTQGIRHMANGKLYDSKSRFRAETRARGLEEVGNDRPEGSRPSPTDYGAEVRQAWQQFDGNWNGTADRVKAEESRSAWRRNNAR